MAEGGVKPEIPYQPAKNAPLDTVAATTTITAHVSPDAGLATLDSFLQKTQSSLVVGMYDFTSGRILQKFISVLGTTKDLQQPSYYGWMSPPFVLSTIRSPPFAGY
jgi:hypothetical protein